MEPELLVAASRAATYGAVSRWLIHDLRNPTQALTLIGELFETEPGDSPDEVRLTIEQAANHLGRSLELLDRVLQLPGPVPLARPLSLGTVVEFVQALHAVHRTGLELRLDSDAIMRLPAVAADEKAVEHVLLILLVNAVEALLPQGEGSIRLDGRVIDGCVELTFRDDGPGVADAVKPRLFEPFVTTKTGMRLAGLGLAAGRVVARSWGGDLLAGPSQGPGASFLLTIPVWSSA